MWFVTKTYRRDYNRDNSGFPSQIEIYSSGFSSGGAAIDEAKRLNEMHHEYMVTTHDADEQGVEFSYLSDDESSVNSFSEASRRGIKLVKADAQSKAWEGWFRLPMKEQAAKAALIRAEYYRRHGNYAQAEAELAEAKRIMGR